MVTRSLLPEISTDEEISVETEQVTIDAYDEYIETAIKEAIDLKKQIADTEDEKIKEEL